MSDRQPTSRYCFVCGRDNPKSLRARWVNDRETRQVRATVSVAEEYNGYPGIVERNGELWISYYSVHEDPNPEGRDSWNQRSSIYLARVRIGGPRFTHPR